MSHQDVEQYPREVLIVEDSLPYRLILRRLVESVPGLQVAGEHAAAPQAIAAVRAAAPDIALLDIQLEEGSGMDVLAVLRDVAPHVAVAIVSTNHDTIFRERFLAAGALRYFHKGEELAGLRAWLQEMAAQPPAAG